MKYLKNVLLVLLLIVAGMALLGVGFKVGEKIFFAYKPPVKDSSPKIASQDRQKPPEGGLARKADEPEAAGEARNPAPPSPAPANTVETASDGVEKVQDPTAVEKRTAQPAPPPPARDVATESPKGSAKPQRTIREAPPPAVAPAAVPVKTEPKSVAKKSEPTAKRPKTHKEYHVIVGSFSIKANADQLLERLKANRFRPRIVRAETPKGELYRVIAGSYRSWRITKAKMAELKTLGFDSFFLLE